MNVLIAAASFSSEISGVQRQAFNMVRCLLQAPEISAVHFVVAPWQCKLVQKAGFDADARLAIHVADMGNRSLERNFWYYRKLPALAARLRADVVHLSYPMPTRATSFPCPTVVTLHDLYPYEIPLNFGFPQVIFNRLILQQCLRNVDAIACVSEITRHRLGQYSPATVSEKAVRIYNCVEPDRTCSIQSPIPGWRGEPFLLCVAQHRRNKNIPLLINTFYRLLSFRQINPEMRLVIVGIAGPESRLIHRQVRRYNLSRSVLFFEGLSEPELQWCYARCEALTAPSSTEGFGLPVVEALLAGCRVVCSDIPALREVGGDDCRFVALGRRAEEALAEAILAALRKPANDSASFPHLSAKVLAGQYMALYHELVTTAARPQDVRLSSSIHAATSERKSL
jgi:glycosyltransferase involved in cell wall biosynthesis